MDYLHAVLNLGDCIEVSLRPLHREQDIQLTNGILRDKGEQLPLHSERQWNNEETEEGHLENE